MLGGSVRYAALQGRSTALSTVRQLNVWQPGGRGVTVTAWYTGSADVPGNFNLRLVGIQGTTCREYQGGNHLLPSALPL